jgi:hypothetical protein
MFVYSRSVMSLRAKACDHERARMGEPSRSLIFGDQIGMGGGGPAANWLPEYESSAKNWINAIPFGCV